MSSAASVIFNPIGVNAEDAVISASAGVAVPAPLNRPGAISKKNRCVLTNRKGNRRHPAVGCPSNHPANRGCRTGRLFDAAREIRHEEPAGFRDLAYYLRLLSGLLCLSKIGQARLEKMRNYLKDSGPRDA